MICSVQEFLWNFVFSHLTACGVNYKEQQPHDQGHSGQQDTTFVDRARKVAAKQCLRNGGHKKFTCCCKRDINHHHLCKVVRKDSTLPLPVHLLLVLVEETLSRETL